MDALAGASTSRLRQRRARGCRRARVRTAPRRGLRRPAVGSVRGPDVRRNDGCPGRLGSTTTRSTVAATSALAALPAPTELADVILGCTRDRPVGDCRALRAVAARCDARDGPRRAGGPTICGRRRGRRQRAGVRSGHRSLVALVHDPEVFRRRTGLGCLRRAHLAPTCGDTHRLWSPDLPLLHARVPMRPRADDGGGRSPSGRTRSLRALARECRLRAGSAPVAADWRYSSGTQVTERREHRRVSRLVRSGGPHPGFAAEHRVRAGEFTDRVGIDGVKGTGNSGNRQSIRAGRRVRGAPSMGSPG